MKFFQFLFSLSIILLVFQSCRDEDNDPCDGVSCMNDGICKEGMCECPPGTSGTNCETVNPCFNVTCLNGSECESGICNCPSGYFGEQCENYISVVDRLQSETPLEIVEDGIPLDSLYGKWYEGGYIFFIDIDDIIPGKEGLIAAENNLEDHYSWGCVNQDTDVVNITELPSYPETLLGARPGDGIENTNIIISSGCSTGSAAKACNDFVSNGFDDWFLPSRGGLLRLYYNLYNKDNIDLGGSFHWTSTEVSSSSAYYVAFNEGNPQPILKESTMKVRPVRAY